MSDKNPPPPSRMSFNEADPAAIELKRIMCQTCYPGMVAWVNGTTRTPFVACKTCAPVLREWLAARGGN